MSILAELYNDMNARSGPTWLVGQPENGQPLHAIRGKFTRSRASERVALVAARRLRKAGARGWAFANIGDGGFYFFRLGRWQVSISTSEEIWPSAHHMCSCCAKPVKS